MSIDEDKRRARWQRNKADERERNKATQQPPSIDLDFESGVWAERDKRYRTFPWEQPRLPDGRAFTRRTCSEELVCDVWAAELILFSRYGQTKISDGKVAKWLIKEGRDHGVKEPSLRTKVWRTRKIVRYLEQAPARKGEGPFWPPYPQSIPEYGSGLMQHIDDVFTLIQHLGLMKHHPLRKPNSDE